LSSQVCRYHDSGAGTVGTETKRGDLQKCPLGGRRLGPQTTASPMGGPAEVLLRIRILLGILFVIAGVIVLGDVIVATTISTIVIGAVRLLGTNDCSGRALSGHVAAPPSSMMNLRRFITRSPRRRGRGASAARRVR